MYNILICDDEPDIVSALKIYLASDGYGIYEAFNGREAIEMMQKTEIHLVLMDIMMPVMDGLETCRKIRTSNHPEGKNIPIIAMTAQVSQECMDKCQLAGMNGHLTKPVTSEKLIKTIMEFTI